MLLQIVRIILEKIYHMELECRTFQRPVYKGQIVKVYESPNTKTKVKFGKIVTSEKKEVMEDDKLIIAEILCLEEIQQPPFHTIDWFLPLYKVNFLTYLPEKTHQHAK